MIRALRPLMPVHLIGNALLLWGAYYWLDIGESRAATLLWSAMIALVLFALACWLHGSAFVYCAEPKGLRFAFAAGARRLPAIAAVALAVLSVYLLLAWLAGAMGKPAFQVASFFTLKLRVPVKPSSVQRTFDVFFWLVRGMLVPALVLPAVADTAMRGWRGFRGLGSAIRPRLYWIEVPLLLLCAFWIPWKLYAWVPEFKSFTMQMASFVVRIGAAYLICVSAWLLLVFITCGGSPRLTQPKTVPSP